MTEAKRSTGRGRPRTVAPYGYVTIREAAEHSGLSYATCYQHALAGTVRAQQDDDGAWRIRRADLDVIRRRPVTPAHKRKRIAIQVRPVKARYDRWVAAAEAAGAPVGIWLMSLADAAS